MKNAFRISTVILLILSISLTHSCKKDNPTIVPGAPTIGTASAGNAQATVAFTAPVSNGGSAITGYTVTSNPGNITGNGTASLITVTGLTNGMAYTFTVTATNSIGTSVASSASNSVTPTAPSSVPGAPTIGTATAGNTQATVTFTAPVSNGGSAITGYSVTSNPGNITASGTASPITVTGLTNGTAYTFIVTATNAIGTSVASSASNSVTPTAPSTVPGAPTIGTASVGNAQAVVTFTAPVSNGGSAITGYTVTSSPGGLTATGTASPITVSGLTNGTAYTFTVTATNAIGTSSASAASNSATPSEPQQSQPEYIYSNNGIWQGYFPLNPQPSIEVLSWELIFQKNGTLTDNTTSFSPVGDQYNHTYTYQKWGVIANGDHFELITDNGTLLEFKKISDKRIDIRFTGSIYPDYYPVLKAVNNYIGTVTDIDGNVYKTVKIGNQEWMAENLRVTKYRDGSSIPFVTGNSQWNDAFLNTKTAAYCNIETYYNSGSNHWYYGRMYNWYTIKDIKNIAPTGWHVPTKSEWETLITYIGGNTVGGGKLKFFGFNIWKGPNILGTNEYSFDAYPTGYRDWYGPYFEALGYHCYLWSSSENDYNTSYNISLSNEDNQIPLGARQKGDGLCIRCVKD